MNGRREQHLRQQMTEGMCCRFQSVSKFVTFESPQALRASALPKKKFLMLQPRVYLKTPNAPGQRAFLRCAASFFLEIRQYSCEKMSCATQKSLAAGHIMSFQIHPSRGGRLCPPAGGSVFWGNLRQICNIFGPTESSAPTEVVLITNCPPVLYRPTPFSRPAFARSGVSSDSS